MKTKIYHNPRCAKSRETLRLLRDHGIEPEIIEYLETPPTAAELKRVLAMLGMKARDLLRTKEEEYKTLGLDDRALSDAVLIRAMVEHPVLIERPIVVTGVKAALGRPPERVADIFR